MLNFRWGVNEGGTRIFRDWVTFLGSGFFPLGENKGSEQLLVGNKRYNRLPEKSKDSAENLGLAQGRLSM